MSPARGNLPLTNSFPSHARARPKPRAGAVCAGPCPHPGPALAHIPRLLQPRCRRARPLLRHQLPLPASRRCKVRHRDCP